AIITGIAPFPDDSGIEVFPNPARDKVWVKVGKRGDYQLTIHELSGREVLTKEFKNDGTKLQEITLNNLNAGAYILSIHANDKVHHLKLIVH
ncbi:MAG: T9SS type A sorting domain-containing protein, partial [Bacteroidales bacterium]|nr:T9SS type A sorting domain-containing protein [Bacteroidales bacterium]